MRYRDAKKLHNGDQVVVKETGEVRTVLTIVISAVVDYDAAGNLLLAHKPYVLIKTFGGSYQEFRHTEVE